MKTEFDKFEWQMARWLETITETETLHFMINAFEKPTAEKGDAGVFDFKNTFAYLFALQGVEAKKCLTDWLTLHFSTAEKKGEDFRIFMAYRSDADFTKIFGMGEINLPNERAQTLFSGYELIQTIQNNAGYSPPAMVEANIIEAPFLVGANPQKTLKGKLLKIV